MQESNNRSGSRRLLWVILAVTAAAAIPIAVYLILTGPGTRKDSGRKGLDPARGESARKDLDRLASQETLYRDAVTVEIGDSRFLEAVEIRKAPGDAVASARSITVHLEHLFLTRKGALDDGLTQFFDAMPPGTGSITTGAFNLHIAEPWEGQPQGLSRASEGMVAREEGSARLVARWKERQQDCSLEVVYTYHSGLLFVRFGCPGAHYPASFLPPGVMLHFDELTLTSSSFLEISRLQLVRGGNKKLFGAEKLTFNSRAAVPRRLFASGLSQDELRRLSGWTLAFEQVESSLGEIGMLPFLQEVAVLPDLAFKARALTAKSAGSMQFDGLELARDGVGSLTAHEARLETRDETRLTLTKARVEEAQWGISVTCPQAIVRVDEFRNLHLVSSGFSIGLPGNPLKLAVVMKELQAVKEMVKKLKEQVLDLPPFVVPEWLPSLQVRLTGGEFVVPYTGGGEVVSGIHLEADVKGGMVEKASAGLCYGDECRKLFLEIRLATDSVGELEEVGLKGGGSIFAGQLQSRLPALITKVGDLSVDCVVTTEDRRGAYKAVFKTVAQDVLVEHHRIAEQPVGLPLMRIEGEARLDTAEHSLILSLPKVQLDEVYFRMAIDLNNYHSVPAFRIAVDFPEQNCASLLRSVPTGFAPLLADAHLTGALWFKGAFEVDLKDIRKSIKIELDGDLEQCDALTLGRAYDVTKLNQSDYVHRVVVHGEDLGIDVGPGVSGYVPLNQIPKVVQAAAYGTEDLAFFRHNGFRLGLIRRALILFLERGYYAYGGSTISQQLVKNLFLTRKKTLSRKFQEAVIVWKMEKEVSKERIFELYLNCIEYGPRIWGISKAARVYFGKHPTQLRAMGAAFIMGLKPDPKYGYLQFSRGKLNRHWRVNLDRVLKRLLDMGAISKSVYDQTMRTNLRFHKPGQVKKATPDEDRPVRTGQEGLEEL